MTKQDIAHVVNEAVKARENSLTSWMKTIITFVFIPIITVYASFKVLENRVEILEKEGEEKVDWAIYDQFIIKQIELQKLYNENTKRIEDDLKESDEEIKAQIVEIKEFLNVVHAEKNLWLRESGGELLYSFNLLSINRKNN